jgi:hypothetical protein
MRRFHQVVGAFLRLLEALRPLSHLDGGRLEFHTLIQSAELLPSSLFKQCKRQGHATRYLLGKGLLVAIAIAAFQTLKKSGWSTKQKEVPSWLLPVMTKN